MDNQFSPGNRALIQDEMMKLGALHQIWGKNRKELEGLAGRLVGRDIGAGARVLQVTSAQSKEGKTTIALLISLALAELGNRVLLIDGNMDCPEIHKILEFPETPGLLETIEAATGPGDRIRNTGFPMLRALPLGGREADASIVEYTERLNEIIEYGRENFEFIVIDSMAANDSVIPRLVGKLVDTSIIVIHSGKSRRKAVENAVRVLKESDVSILGTILNRRKYHIPASIYERL